MLLKVARDCLDILAETIFSWSHVVAHTETAVCKCDYIGMCLAGCFYEKPDFMRQKYASTMHILYDALAFISDLVRWAHVVTT